MRAARSPSDKCEQTICKMFKGKSETKKNCNKVYYYLDSTKTHPDGGWFTCRNENAGFFSSKEPKPCRSKAGLPKKRQKPGENFYGNNGILYKAFKDTFEGKFGEYSFLREDEHPHCGSDDEIKKATKNPIIYLVHAPTQTDIHMNKFISPGELFGLIRRFTTNFHPFPPPPPQPPTTTQTEKVGGRTKRKRKKMRRKTRVKRKKTQKRKKAKRKYKKRRTKRRR